MTEAELLACEKTLPMFGFISGTSSNLKLRLLACSYCRLIPKFMESVPDRQSLEPTE